MVVVKVAVVDWEVKVISCWDVEVSSLEWPILLEGLAKSIALSPKMVSVEESEVSYVV